MVEIDGSRYSGSGTIVRQAVAFAALTGKAVHIVRVRARRPKPGLRPQHIRVVEAIRELVGGTSGGIHRGSQEIFFCPGKSKIGQHYKWDIGTAGSTTALALAVLPVLAFGPASVSVELRGGVFQDFASSFYHLEQVMLPLLRRMGIDAEVKMGRPGYVPRGGGILNLTVRPIRNMLRPLVLEEAGEVKKVWGVSLSSHLQERGVSNRMAEAAKEVFAAAGYDADFEMLYNTTALQPGAALAAFADLACGSRLGSDQAGARGRRAEAIGRKVAHQLLKDVGTGATLDRYAGDQIIPFASLADGESRIRIPDITDHMRSSAWLVREFFAADVRTEEQLLVIRGIGLKAVSAYAKHQPNRSESRG